MNLEDLDRKIKEYYLGQSLSEASVQRILNVPAEPKARAWWAYWAPVAVAASIVMVLAFQLGARYDQSDFAAEVAAQVALRHNTSAEFDRSASCYTSAQRALSGLSFSVAPLAKHQLLSAYEVVGARYCQLKGQEAAHLQVRNRATGEICTLFVAALGGKLGPLWDDQEEIDLPANHVSMWTDSGRFFALVD